MQRNDIFSSYDRQSRNTIICKLISSKILRTHELKRTFDLRKNINDSLNMISKSLLT